MRKKLVRTSATVFVTLLTLCFPFVASIYAMPWYERWQATRILARVRQFEPGETTEVQARESLKSLSKREIKYTSGEQTVSQYDFPYLAEWQNKILKSLPESWRQQLDRHHWTLFTVNVRYLQGFLAELHATEMQEVQPGEVHPCAASVSILSTRLEPRSTARFPDGFEGFSATTTNTQRVDQHGIPIGPEIDPRERIVLDERASPQQRAQALDFQLHCLTSIAPCNEVHKILPASPPSASS